MTVDISAALSALATVMVAFLGYVLKNVEKENVRRDATISKLEEGREFQKDKLHTQALELEQLKGRLNLSESDRQRAKDDIEKIRTEMVTKDDIKGIERQAEQNNLLMRELIMTLANASGVRATKPSIHEG